MDGAGASELERLRRHVAALQEQLADSRAQRDATLEELERVWAETARVRLAWWNPYRLVQRLEELRSWRDGFRGGREREPRPLPPPFWEREPDP